MSSRGFMMQHIGKVNVATDDFVPFTNIITNWAATPDHLISYDTSSKHFMIPFASFNDYFFCWQLQLKTASIVGSPIIALEFFYNNVYRHDYIIAPLKTEELVNTSIYHIVTPAPNDTLSIGLKVIGPPNHTYTFESNSTCNIAANITILGL